MSRFVLVVLPLVVGCSRAPAPLDAGPSVARPGWGSVMSEVGRRFELAGRAVNANRFELAAFEADEIAELFENDLPNAELPKEGPVATLPSMADAFGKTHPAELARAAKAKDARAFAEAFQRAAASCNACHQSSGHAFIQIPSVAGKGVPDLDPLP